MSRRVVLGVGATDVSSVGFSRSANGASMEATIKTSTNSLNTGIPSQSTNP
jgi:hypothetical protein